MKNRKIGHFRPKNGYKIRKIAVFLLIFLVLGFGGHFIYRSFAATFSVRCKYGTGTCDDDYKHWFGDGYVDEHIIDGAKPRTSEYIITYDGTDYDAMCAEAAYGNATLSFGTISVYTGMGWDASRIKAVLLTAPGGPLYSSSLYTNMKDSSGLTGHMSYNDDYGIAHSILSLIYSRQTVGWSDAGADRLNSAGIYLENYVKNNHPEYLSSYDLMLLYRPDSEAYFVQDLFFLMPVDTPSVDLNITVIKKSSTDGSVLSGAVFGIYSDSSATTLVKTMPATGSDGKSSVTGLSAGTYYIKEITAPSGFALNPVITTVTLIEGDPEGGETVTILDLPQQSTIDAIKYDSATLNKLSGAVFGLYDRSCTTRISGTTSKTTGSDGKVSFSGIVAGEYCVVEETAPSGYSKAAPQTAVVEPGGTIALNFYDSVIINNGKIRIIKESSRPSLTNGNSYYSLAGAEYYLCSDSVCGTKITTLTTGDTGYTAWYEVVPGTYYVKEKTAPSGFNIDESVKTVVVGDGETKEVRVSNTPILGSITVRKKDAETGRAEAFSGGALDGTMFEIRDISGAKIGEITINNGEAEMTELPLGAYSVKESLAGEGYAVNTEIIGVVLNVATPDKTVDFSNGRIRGDVKFKKVDQDGKAMSGVQFKITAVDNGVELLRRQASELSLSVDEYLGKLNEKLKKFSDFEGAVAGSEKYLVTDSEGFATTVDNPDVWFGDMAYEQSVGNLPYGVYVIEEIAGKANEGYTLVTPMVVFVSQNGGITNLGEFVDTYIEIKPDDPDEPQIIPDTGAFTGVNEFLKENVVIFTTFGAITGVGIVVFVVNKVNRRKVSYRFGRKRR